MTDYQVWDLVLKIITAAGLLIGGAIGLWKYFDTSKKEFRKPFWERQLALYLEATSAAATLATVNDEEKWKEAWGKFWQLYYGPLALVEDTNVESAMVDFGNTLERCKQAGENRTELEMKSLTLAISCRESIGKSWKVKLAALERGNIQALER